TLSENLDKLFDGFIRVEGPKFTLNVNTKRRHRMWGDLNLVFIKVKDEFVPIDKFECDFDLWIELHEINEPKGKQYKSLDTGEVIANFISHSIISNRNQRTLISLIQPSGESDVRLQISESEPDKSPE